MLVGSLAVCLILSSLLPGSAAAGSIPASASISGVTGHPQTYTLSCEARSAADWAAYWGVDFSEDEFLEGIPSSNNPDQGFVGDVNGAWGNVPPHSYGMYARPVAARLRQYGLQAEAQRGLEWDDLRAEIAAGRPVIVWVIGQMWNGTAVTFTASNGKKVLVARYEHTMILIGYTASQVRVVDAYSGNTQTYALNTFLTSWAVLGNMAVFGQGDEAAAPASGQSGQASYTVQRGDYLTGLAERFNVGWQELADLNNLITPYTIYAGQVLKLPASPAGSSKKPAATQAPSKTAKPPSASPTPAPKAPSVALPYKILAPLVMQTGVENAPVETAAPARLKKKQPETYTVQRGDFLIDLADKLGVDWRKLAELNEISFPWVIYPGQVLTLPSN